MYGDILTAFEPDSLRIDELADIIECERGTLLIDTRPFLAFRQAHILGSVNLYVPPLLLRRLRKNGCSSIEKITNCQDIKNRLSKRHDVPIVVYTDSASNRSCPLNLRTVVDALMGDCHKLYVLEDPFDDFSTFYPHLVSMETVKHCVTSLPGSMDSDKLSARSRSPRSASLIGSNRPSEIMPLLFLGNEKDSSDLHLLRKLGVSKVLNVSRNCVNHFPDYFEYMNLPVEDRVYADISQHFNKALHFIEQARGEGCSILVHCRAGISRSATVVMAYLIQYYNKNMEEAFDFIKMKHPCISPNFNFMGQLLQFQNERAAKKSDGSTPSSDHWEAQEEEEEEEEESVVLSLSAITTATLPLLLPVERDGEEEEECLPNPPDGARGFAFGE